MISGCRHNFRTRDPLLERSKRSKCSPPELVRRDRRELLNRSIKNTTLWRRVMTLPTDLNRRGGIEGFITEETGEDGEAIETVWQVPDDEHVGQEPPKDINTALFDDFK